MAEGLDNIVVGYKLDITELKQQLSEIKSGLEGLKAVIDTNATAGGKSISDNICGGLQDVSQLARQAGIEVKQAFAASSMDNAVQGANELAMAMDNVSKKSSSLSAQIKQNTLRIAGEAVKAITVTTELAAKASAGNINKIMQEIKEDVTTVSEGISGLVSDIFTNMTMNLQKQIGYANAELDRWNARATLLAGDNAAKQAAIARDYQAEQTQLKQQSAIKEAEIARKQAEITKALKLSEIAMNLAVTVVKDEEEISVAMAGLPATAPALALAQAAMAQAIAGAAIQTAVVAAQPLPQIPKFATGVIGFKGKGTETSDSNLALISHNESIINAAATNKYTDELEAINNLKFENLVFEKYLLPMLRSANPKTVRNDAYDDWKLRKEIRDANVQGAQFIVKGIVKGLKISPFLNTYYR